MKKIIVLVIVPLMSLAQFKNYKIKSREPMYELDSYRFVAFAMKTLDAHVPDTVAVDMLITQRAYDYLTKLHCQNGVGGSDSKIDIMTLRYKNQLDSIVVRSKMLEDFVQTWRLEKQREQQLKEHALKKVIAITRDYEYQKGEAECWKAEVLRLQKLAKLKK